MTFFDDDSGYELDDPKHPTWAERMADRDDDERKRAKEDTPPGDFFCECDDAGCTATINLTLDEMIDLRVKWPTHGRYYIVLAGHEYGETVAADGIETESGCRISVVRGYPNLPREQNVP